MAAEWGLYALELLVAVSLIPFFGLAAIGIVTLLSIFGKQLKKRR